MGIAPVVAIPRLLEMTGLAKDDVNLWEVRGTLHRSPVFG